MVEILIDVIEQKYINLKTNNKNNNVICFFKKHYQF
jgi:hypothetical protein